MQRTNGDGSWRMNGGGRMRRRGEEKTIRKDEGWTKKESEKKIGEKAALAIEKNLRTNI